MKEILEECKFKVSMYIDLRLEQMKQHLHEFTQKIKFNDEVVFYFSGHGIEYKGEQLYIPCLMEEPSEELEILLTAFSVDDAIKNICNAVSRGLKIIISDACRAEYMHVLKDISSRTGVHYNEFNVQFNPNNNREGITKGGPMKGGVTKIQSNLVRMFAVSRGENAEAGTRENLSVYTKSLAKFL